MKNSKHLRRMLALVAISLLVANSQALAWDPVRDFTGKNLSNLVKDRLNNLGHQAEKFIKDPVGYAVKLPRSVLADVCSAPVQYYGGTLAGQANGHWKSLPPQLISGIQRFYSNDLSVVRYAENIRTSNGDPQAFGNLIYFTYPIDLTNPNHMHTMLHELEHTTQYSGESRAEKLCEYMAKAVGSGGQHDRIDWERAAERKADYVLPAAMQAIYQIPIGTHAILVQNDTNIEIVFYLESASSDTTEFRLPPRTQDVFESDNPSENWFNIAVYTTSPAGNMEVKYGVDGGTTQRMYFRRDGILDIAQQ